MRCELCAPDFTVLCWTPATIEAALNGRDHPRHRWAMACGCTEGRNLNDQRDRPLRVFDWSRHVPAWTRSPVDDHRWWAAGNRCFPEVHLCNLPEGAQRLISARLGDIDEKAPSFDSAASGEVQGQIIPGAPQEAGRGQSGEAHEGVDDPGPTESPGPRFPVPEDEIPF